MTIMERARCIRLYVEFPLQFWDDVVDTTAYLINIGPLSTLDGVILIKKIEKILRLNPRNAPLLDTGLMILVIAYGILKIAKSLGVEM